MCRDELLLWASNEPLARSVAEASLRSTAGSEERRAEPQLYEI